MSFNCPSRSLETAFKCLPSFQPIDDSLALKDDKLFLKSLYLLVLIVMLPLGGA